MDAKDMTAVEWLDIQFKKGVDCNPLDISCHAKAYDNLFEQAKEMEKEQIMKAARQCHFEGLRQTGKNSEEYLKYGNDYYNETYNK